MTPDDIEAIAALGLRGDAGGGLHHGRRVPLPAQRTRTARATPIRPRWPARIVAAARRRGIGLTLLPCFYAHGGCGGTAAEPGQARFLSDLDGFWRLMEASRAPRRQRSTARALGIAPHSLRAVDAAELRGAGRQRRPPGPIHIHAAEQVREVEECLAWSGARPVQWLLDNMRLDARWCLIHCTHMTPEESRGPRALRRRGRPVPDHRGQSRRRHFRRPRDFSHAGGRFARRHGQQRAHRRSTRSCARSSTRSACASRSATAWGPPARPRGAICSMRRASGGAQALGLGRRSRGRAKRRHRGARRRRIRPSSAATVIRCIDSWIFAAGDTSCAMCSPAASMSSSEGRHVRRDAVLARFAAAMRRLPI